MSDDEGIFSMRIPLWQVIIGVVAAYSVQYFIGDGRKPGHKKHHSKTDLAADVAKEEPKQKEAEPEKKAEAPTEEVKKSETEAEADAESDDYDEPYDPDYLFYDEPYLIEDNYTMRDAPFKMVLVVNMELKMGKGKIAAQCGHATMGAYKLSRKHCRTALHCWERHGTAKVVVKAEQEQELYDILQGAKTIGVVAYIVEDAGRTQIAAGSRTVLALGPAPAVVIDQLTGHLKLL